MRPKKIPNEVGKGNSYLRNNTQSWTYFRTTRTQVILNQTKSFWITDFVNDQSAFDVTVFFGKYKVIDGKMRRRTQLTSASDSTLLIFGSSFFPDSEDPGSQGTQFKCGESESLTRPTESFLLLA